MALFLKKNCFVTCDTKTQWSAFKHNFNKDQHSLLINVFYKYLIQQWIGFSHDSLFSCLFHVLDFYLAFGLDSSLQFLFNCIYGNCTKAYLKLEKSKHQITRFKWRTVKLSKHILQPKIKKHCLLLSELIIHWKMEK